MGIASWALGDDNPFAKYVADNKNLVHGAFAGLGQGKTFASGLGQAALYAQQGGVLDTIARKDREDEAKEEKGRNATADWLRNSGDPNLMELADMVDSGALTGADAFKTAWDYQNGGGVGASAPSNVQEWQYYSQLSPEDQSRYLNMKRSNTPLNIGTGFVTQDQANPGTTIGAPIAINNEQRAFDTATGTGLGAANAENIVSYESMNSKMPGLRSVIDNLTQLADTATYTQSGQAMDAVKRELGLPVGQGAIDRTSYISIVDNQVLPLLRDIFGAAFTVQEGESLRATLGDPNKSPAEKKAVLDAFIAQKERDVAAMRSRISGGQAPAGGSVDDILSGYGL